MSLHWDPELIALQGQIAPRHTAATERHAKAIEGWPERVAEFWQAAVAAPEHQRSTYQALMRWLAAETRGAAFALRSAIRGLERSEHVANRIIDRAASRFTEEIAAAHTLSLTTAIELRGHYVYCLWDKDDARPFYVGRSSNVLARLGDHARAMDRRGRIRRVTLSRCTDAKHAERLESDLIRHYQPELNIRGIEPRAHPADGEGE